MHRAWEQARVAAADCGYFLWLNDDTVLTPEALSVLLDAISRIDSTAGRVVVGGVGDGQSPSYGGRVRSSHWRRTAQALGATIVVLTHARASRGSLPASDGMVIIDESHHFRNPLTRRYAAVAPWLLGRRALLLSATPVVNRLDDLAAQLRLAVRDDALAASGIGSLCVLLASGLGHPALSDLVIS
jgi:hypothetical protein